MPRSCSRKAGSRQSRTSASCHNHSDRVTIYNASADAWTWPRAMNRSPRFVCFWAPNGDWSSDAPSGGIGAMFEAIERGTMKALWVRATSPGVSLPRAGAFRVALKKLELFIVSETTLHNDTVEAGAHVLLPAAAWGEKDGTVTNSERRISRQRAFLPRPGEAQPDWWIVSEAAQRLGFESAFAYRRPADVFCEHAALSAFENDGRRDFGLGGLAALADDDYDRLDAVMWPGKAGVEPGEARFFSAGAVFTSDPRWRLI